MAVLIAKKLTLSIFVIGLLVMAILSVLGLVYLSKMAFNDQANPDGTYCAGTSTTERNIARLAIITLWIQFFWILLGQFLNGIWS